jgi:hypothetical protein
MASFDQTSAGSVLSQCDNHATLNGTKDASTLSFHRCSLIRCTAHGESCCWVQLNGEHVSWKRCTCFGETPRYPAGNGGSHWAGAQRPKDGSGEAATGRRRRLGSPNPQVEGKRPQGEANLCENTNRDLEPSNLNLKLKLRQQAKELGLVPGSPRWRAYVLGTISAAAQRKRKKEQAKCS